MPQNHIELHFGDGDYLFRLTLSGIQAIQEKCGNCGIGAVWQRLAASRFNYVKDDGEQVGFGVAEAAAFKIEDIIEPIRQGLIGGGMGTVDGVPVAVTPLLANKLVQTYVIDRPLSEAWSVAFAVISALIEGYDPPKKKEPRKPKPRAKVTKDVSTTPVP